ncbi:MAG: sulfatase-like hydrolase/transferase [Bacteroidetes bacterium]|nr:sulfatase-like hydrolase/transferase [Bacteroidota bacterium]
MNKTKTKRPNVLVFLTDDHAQWALKCYGNKHIVSPNIDYLADEGVVFENAFTPTPVCSPARACFHTGKIPSQHGIHDFLASDNGADDEKQWLQDELTMGELFQQAGYYTGFSGKWHMGQENKIHQGYDECLSLGTKYPMEHGEVHTYVKNGEPLTLSGYKTQVVTDHAISFIDNAPPDKPFFLFVGHYATHSPWTNHPERLVSFYRGKDIDENFFDENYLFGVQALESTNLTRENPKEALAQYYAAVTQIDESVGRILDHLQAKEVTDDTLIVYTSDHGLNCGHHGIWGKGNGTLPLNMVEESIRIPLIMRMPGILPQGSRKKEFVDHTDTFRTVLEIAGISQNLSRERERQYTGKSVLSLFRDKNLSVDWRSYQFCEYGMVRMIRSDRYKLIVRNSNQKDQLFDLQSDPRELTNLIDNSAYHELITSLKILLTEFYIKFENPVKSGVNVMNPGLFNDVHAWRSE